MNSLYRKLSFSEWNIAISNYKLEDFIKTQKLSSDFKWIKKSNDRFLADPFILNLDSKYIYVLAEELIYKEYLGRIVLLTIDIETAEIINRKIVIEKENHLSFPCIYRENNKTYIIPENGDSGKLSIYEYDKQTNTVKFLKVLIDEPLIDSVLFKENGCYWILCGNSRNKPNEELYVYKSDSLLGEYKPISNNPFIHNISSSRSGSSVFKIGNDLYRAVQDSKNGYGTAMRVKKIRKIDGSGYNEESIFKICPMNGYYQDGIHTINFYNDMCVIDGNHLNFSPIKKILSVLNLKLKYIWNNKKHH